MSRTMHATPAELRRPRSSRALRQARRTGTRRAVIAAHTSGRI